MAQGEILPAASVLVADDDPVGNAYCSHLLRTAGFHCLSAADGASAIGQALAHRPGLILMDLHFPDMSGLEAAQHIAAHWPSGHRDGRMIAMTAGDGKIPAGLFVTLLIKPFSPETLLATVTDTLTRTGHQRPYEGLTWKSILAPAPDQPWAVHDARTPQALFQQDLDRNLHELDHYLTTLDWHGANRLLHRWCGAASLLGFWRMAALCRRMQGQLLPTVSTAAVADTYYALSCEAAVVGKSGALQQD